MELEDLEPVDPDRVPSPRELELGSETVGCRRGVLRGSEWGASSCARLVGLEGRAACAELLRLAAGVFEFRACVGVDQLAGLDPLEAVSF